MVNLLRRPWGWLIAAAILFGGALHSRSAASPVIQQPPATPAPSGTGSASQPVATDDEVKVRCTACHKLPPPDILPRSAWRDEMVRMMLIQEGVPETQSSPDLLPLPPDWLPILRYYEGRAPEQLPVGLTFA